MKPSRLRARYWQIVFFFGRIVLSFIFWELFLARIGLRGWVRGRAKARYTRYARRFRAMAIRMGGLMIKVGQFLSSRLDVLPPEITEELADLQDEAFVVPVGAGAAEAEEHQHHEPAREVRRRLQHAFVALQAFARDDLGHHPAERHALHPGTRHRDAFADHVPRERPVRETFGGGIGGDIGHRRQN